MNGVGAFSIRDLTGASRSRSAGDDNYSQSLASATLYGGGLVTGGAYSNGTINGSDDRVGIDGGDVAIRATIEEDFVIAFELDGYDENDCFG